MSDQSDEEGYQLFKEYENIKNEEPKEASDNE